MDLATGISIFFNFLFVGAFIIDRVYRIKNLTVIDKANKAQLDAKDAQIVTLKERLDFITNHNDDYLVTKFKSRIENLKSLISDKDYSPEFRDKLIELKDIIEALKVENESLKSQQDSLLEEKTEATEAASRLLSAFFIVMKVIDAKKQWELFEEVREDVQKQLNGISETVEFRDISNDY